MKDIKELALKTLDAMAEDGLQVHNITYESGNTGVELDESALDEFATRLIAAYLAEQEPVSLYPCGFKELNSLVIKNGAYLARGMYEGEPVTESIRSAAMVLIGYAKDMSILLAKQPLYAAPVKDSLTTEPEPSEFSAEQRDKDWSAIKSTAPSSEEVREMVERLCEAEDGPVRRKGLLKDAADLIERLAARVPDGCVVVPKDLIDAAKNLLAVKGRHHTELAYNQLCQALIAAGEVKP